MKKKILYIYGVVLMLFKIVMDVMIGWEVYGLGIIKVLFKIKYKRININII